MREFVSFSTSVKIGECRLGEDSRTFVWSDWSYFEQGILSGFLMEIRFLSLYSKDVIILKAWASDLNLDFGHMFDRISFAFTFKQE